MALSDGVSLGILFLILAGLYRLAGRALDIFEMGVGRFLDDFEKIADGIERIAKSPPTR